MENKNSVVLVAMLLCIVVGALSFYEDTGKSPPTSQEPENSEQVFLYETQVDWRSLSDLENAQVNFQEGIELKAYVPDSADEVRHYFTGNVLKFKPSRLAPAVKEANRPRQSWYEQYSEMHIGENLKGMPTRFAPAKDSDDLVTGSAGMTFLYKPKKHREVELKLSDQHLELKVQKSF